MFNQIKDMWGHYFALTIFVSALTFPISWVYRLALNCLGPDLAQLVLTATIIFVMAFWISGVVHAHRIKNILQGQVMALKNPPSPGTTVKPFEFRLFGLMLFRYPKEPFEFKVGEENEDDEAYMLNPLADKNCPKPRRIPLHKIRKAVLKWENRDKFAAPMALEEFLEKEFGLDNGVPRMAPSTFYDWRRRLIKNTKSQDDQDSDN